MRYFLLIYDTGGGHLKESRDLGADPHQAADAYSACEAEYRERSGFEIVLVGARSLATIRRTHAQYFDPDWTAADADLLDVV